MSSLFCNLILLTACFTSTASTPFYAQNEASNIERYLQWQKKYPEAFGACAHHERGEIEISLDPTEIESIQETQYKRLLPKIGHQAAFEASRIGIIAEDQYWIWLRDPVIFPSKAKGTYNRIYWKSQLSGPGGVIILAQVPDGKIILTLNFRHATRSWELELPRGAREEGESIEEAARRELKEETGYMVNQFFSLGNVNADSGTMTGRIPIFYGKVLKNESNEIDFSEAIEDKVLLTSAQLKHAFETGSIEITIRGKPQKVYCRDSLTAFAFLQATIRGILTP